MAATFKEAFAKARVGRLPNPETILARRMLATMNGGAFTKRAAAAHLVANIGDNQAILSAILNMGGISLVERALKAETVPARLSNGVIVRVPRYMSFGTSWRDINYMTTAQYRQHVEEDRLRVQYDRSALQSKEDLLSTLTDRNAHRVSDVLMLEDDGEVTDI